MIYKHCKRCRGTGFDPDIDMPGTCEHTAKSPVRDSYKPSMIAPNDRRIFMLPRASVRWYGPVVASATKTRRWINESAEETWRRLKKS